MLRDKEDKIKLETLLISLNIWSASEKNRIIHHNYLKETGSLYRFGIFDINGYNYSISGWKFLDGIVTFESERTGEKIKYNIKEHKLVYGNFKKDKFIKKTIKMMRIKLSKMLKDLSDKLQP